MFICKKCGTKKRILNKENNKCLKCGSESFTTKEMMRAENIFNSILNKQRS